MLFRSLNQRFPSKEHPVVRFYLAQPFKGAKMIEEMMDSEDMDEQPAPSGEVDLVTEFIRMREQYQVFHWATTSFALHKGCDWIFDELSCNIDKFMESYLGAFGRGVIRGPFKVILLDPSAIDPAEFTQHCIEIVDEVADMIKGNPDLENITADMLGAFHKLLYLLTLS